MKTRIPHSILTQDLLEIEIKTPFLKLAMKLNLNFNVTSIMDQNGRWNSRCLYKPFTCIFLIAGASRCVLLPNFLSSKLALD